MKLSDLMELRSICKAFLESTMDETHGDVIADDVIAGQLEALLEKSAKAYRTHFLSGGLDAEWVAIHLLLTVGVEIKAEPVVTLKSQENT